jgi:predicted nucleic acid-binding protein
VAETVDRLLEADEVALCGPVVTELVRGIRSRGDRMRMVPLLDGCHLLHQPPRLWEEAGELGTLLGRRGAAVKSLDLLIATYALAHSVPILTLDRDFTTIRGAGVHLTVVSR